MQDALSPSGLQGLSVEALKPDSLIYDWLSEAGALLPHEERKAYKQYLLEEALTWRKLPVVIPLESRLRLLIRLNGTDDNEIGVASEGGQTISRLSGEIGKTMNDMLSNVESGTFIRVFQSMEIRHSVKSIS